MSERLFGIQGRWNKLDRKSNIFGIMASDNDTSLNYETCDEKNALRESLKQQRLENEELQRKLREHERKERIKGIRPSRSPSRSPDQSPEIKKIFSSEESSEVSSTKSIDSDSSESSSSSSRGKSKKDGVLKLHNCPQVDKNVSSVCK